MGRRLWLELPAHYFFWFLPDFLQTVPMRGSVQKDP